MPILQVNGAEINYDVAGKGQPFVMIHAGIAHSAMWDPQFERFARDYQVIRYDQRGFGKTETHTNDFDPRGCASPARPSRRQTRHFYGLLNGRLAGTRFHDAKPRACIGAHSDCTGISGKVAGCAQSTVETSGRGACRGRCGPLDIGTEMWWMGQKRARGAADAGVRQKVREMELDNLKHNTDDLKSAPLDPPALGRLGQVAVPTLIIIGDGDQPHTVDSAHILTVIFPTRSWCRFKTPLTCPAWST